ncbi:MAG: hypothetical protein ACYSWQ_00835 [Planctomycetota bacterium]|jgi:hypothetical protein
MPAVIDKAFAVAQERTMSFYIERLCYVIAGSSWIFFLGILTTRGWHQRFLLLGTLLGLFIYSGIGSTMEGVVPEFAVFYIVFALAIVAGFGFARIFFLPMSRSIGRHIPTALPNLDHRRLWKGVILAYLLLSAFPLFWPEFRLHQLLAPSQPDLMTIFFLRFHDRPDAVTQIVNYARILITPFFFISLYRYRFRLKWVAMIFCLLLYLKYVVDFSYVGRGMVMLHVSILFLAGWILYPKARPKLTILFISCIPIFLVAGYVYAVIRIGGTLGDISLSESANAVLGVELSFVRRAGMVIYKTEARVNLADFVKWIITLPIPKLLTGPIEGSRINYEISELVLDLPTGSPGFYVVLPGLVGESIYIYGKHFFWVHGLFIGGLAAFFSRLMERVPQFLFLSLYVALLFGYNLNRAGIASLLPILTNQLLLFYFFVLTIIFRPMGLITIHGQHNDQKNVKEGV